MHLVPSLSCQPVLLFVPSGLLSDDGLDVLVGYRSILGPELPLATALGLRLQLLQLRISERHVEVLAHQRMSAMAWQADSAAFHTRASLTWWLSMMLTVLSTKLCSNLRTLLTAMTSIFEVSNL